MKHRWQLRWAARYVAKWEGFLPYAYRDTGGVLTIGYGHTNGVYVGQTCTKAQALKWLTHDLREASRAVDRYVTRRMSVRQRIAWISFTFNCGAGALAESTALHRFNEGNVKGAAAALLWWDKDARGEVLLGLQRRRRSEAWLLTHPYAPKRNPHRGGAFGLGKAHR